jgi:hypothetical protein
MLLLLPVISLISYTAMWIVPVLGVVKVMKIAENATDYSINNTARHVLWLPVPGMTYQASPRSTPRSPASSRLAARPCGEVQVLDHNRFLRVQRGVGAGRGSRPRSAAPPLNQEGSGMRPEPVRRRGAAGPRRLRPAAAGAAGAEPEPWEIIEDR